VDPLEGLSSANTETLRGARATAERAIPRVERSAPARNDEESSRSTALTRRARAATPSEPLQARGASGAARGEGVFSSQDGVSVSISAEARTLFERSQGRALGDEDSESVSGGDEIGSERITARAIGSSASEKAAAGTAVPRAEAPDGSASSPIRAEADDAREEEALFGSERLGDSDAGSEVDPAATQQASAASRFIAVRVGPAPLPLTQSTDAFAPAEVDPAAALQGRAILRAASQVLSLPEPSIGTSPSTDAEAGGRVATNARRTDADASDASRTQRRSVAELPEARELPGLETRDARETGREEERSERSFELPGRSEESAARLGFRSAAATDPRPRVAQQSLGARLETGSSTELSTPRLSRSGDLASVTSVAPQSGAIGDTREASREATAASPTRSQPDVADDAEREISQLGNTVEASASEAIVTRFLENVEPEDPGPVPRPREFIGSRSAA